MYAGEYGHKDVCEMLWGLGFVRAPQPFGLFLHAFQYGEGKYRYPDRPGRDEITMAMCRWLIRKGCLVDHMWTASETSKFQSMMRVDHLQGRKIDLLVWVNTTLSDAAAVKLARRGMPFLPECLHCIIAAYVAEDSTSLQRIGESAAFCPNHHKSTFSCLHCTNRRMKA
tara:strand:+ start:866 stop:1372 length:507 start_codon:yes stop_codon:yes gene_type:complete